MPLVVQSPIYLLLLLPLVGGLVLSWRQKAWVAQGRTALLWRGAALTLLILALAQPAWGELSTSVAPTVFLVDTSASTAGPARLAAQQWLQRTLATLPTSSVKGLVTFAGEPQRQLLPPDPMQLVVHQAPLSTATNLERGLNMALGLVGTAGHVVVLSDGLETSGNALAVVGLARALRDSIDVAAITASPRTDAAVTRLQLPTAVYRGDAIPALLTVRSTVATSGTIMITDGALLVGKESIALREGENPFMLTLPAAAAGWQAYRATVTIAGDAVPQNDSLDATTQVMQTPHLLVVTAPGEAAGQIVSSLTAWGFTIQAMTPGQLPRTSTSYAQFDGVVLNDVAATALDDRQMSALEQAVRVGGLGVLVLGGPHSLTLGHYSQTTLEHLLPVLSVTPSSLDQGAVALQLVLDRSGSMQDLAGGDVPKIQMSQAAADSAADFVEQHKDDLGIVSFDLYAHVLVPMQKIDNSASDTQVHRAVANMTADGGTNIYDALRQGLTQVLKSSAPYRHVILMTDGVSAPANYTPLIHLLTAQHVTLSTIGLGSDADVGLLKQLAVEGKGRFYYTNNGADLPHIFAEEARLSAGAAGLHGHIALSLGSSAPAIRSLSSSTLTPLAGYVATVLKPGAVDDLVAPAQGGRYDPVLAQWQYGLGRVLVWTSGSSSSWAAQWTGQQMFWQDAIHWMNRGITQPLLAAQLLPGSTPPAVRIDTGSSSGATLDLAQLSATIESPTHHSSHIAFSQVAPGQYTALLPQDGAGIYRLTVRDAGTQATTTLSTLAVPYNPEYLPNQTNWTLLHALASQTGGQILAESGVRTHTSETKVDLWGLLVGIGLACFLMDIVVRVTVAAKRQTVAVTSVEG